MSYCPHFSSVRPVVDLQVQGVGGVLQGVDGRPARGGRYTFRGWMVDAEGVGGCSQGMSGGLQGWLVDLHGVDGRPLQGVHGVLQGVDSCSQQVSC